MNKKYAVIDGANIAYIEESQKRDPKVANVLAVRLAVEKKGYEPIVIIDASLIYKIDDRQQLEKMIDDQEVHQAPAETDADYFVIKTAEDYHAIIISNDRYEPYQKEFPWIEERRVPVLMINGQAELYEPKLEELSSSR
jgi:hypothetical protein